MNPAILSEVALLSVPTETVNTSIPIAAANDAVVTPVAKKTFTDYFTDDTIRFLVVMNSIWILGHIMGMWD